MRENYRVRKMEKYQEGKQSSSKERQDNKRGGERDRERRNSEPQNQ